LQILWEAIQNSVVFHLSGDGLFYINCEVHAYSCLIGAGGRTYTQQARLWQQCTGQHPSLPYMQAAISSECGSVLDLQFWCSDHISDALVIVSWIQVPKRMEYKIAVWAYAVIHGAAPWPLGPFTNFVGVSTHTSIYHCCPCRCSVFQAINYWQPSFSGCCHWDVECTAWQCRIGIIHQLILAPTEDFPGPLFVLLLAS